MSKVQAGISVRLSFRRTKLRNANHVSILNTRTLAQARYSAVYVGCCRNRIPGANWSIIVDAETLQTVKCLGISLTRVVSFHMPSWRGNVTSLVSIFVYCQCVPIAHNINMIVTY
jgi:hypothetical protein